MTAPSLDGFDLRALPDGFHDDPYPWYRRLREVSPVRPMPDGSWLLTRHADCERVYKDPRVFVSDKRIEFAPKFGDSPLFEHHTTSLVFNDPPLHTRVRRLITGALAPRAIADMGPGLVRLVDRLLDELPGHDAPDLIEHFAAAIPIEIIGNLLQVPHADRAPLRGWSLAILGALEPHLGPPELAAGNRAVTEFSAYLAGLVEQRRSCPGDPDRDVLTRLILGEPAGGRLSTAELLHNCIFLLNAGHETTTNLIGNSLVLLDHWRDQRAQLVAEPELADSAVEEFLRFESSNQLGNRRAVEATEVGGVALPRGALVTLCIGAANRDPAQFPDPDRLDITRSPNRHLAFGSGIHLCAGHMLARLEGRIAVGRFLARFPRYRLASEPVRGRRVRFRGFLKVPVALD
ncbi:MAG: cytochrome P450 [Betaproteobacteria bacterium]|jgi:hypothetical protein